jgi:hypothetical protein
VIYILNTFDDMPHWYSGFCGELYHGLDKILGRHGVCGGAHSAFVMDLKDKDWILVTSHKDLDIAYLRETKAKVAYCHQGSGANPYFEYIDDEKEQKQLQVVDLHLFTLPTFEKLVKERYNLKNTATIGFPLDLPSYDKYKLVKKRKKIVVSGHITPGKQFYLATYLLKDLIPEYEVWFSVIEREGGVTGTWSTFYDLQRFMDMGFKFTFNHPTQEKFYEFLSDASHVFTCSLADTIALPIVEGALCGCTPIVPNIRNYWGQYMDYTSYGYVPFAKENIQMLISNTWYMKEDITTPVVDTKWFDSKLVVERLLEVLK